MSPSAALSDWLAAAAAAACEGSSRRAGGGGGTRRAEEAEEDKWAEAESGFVCAKDIDCVGVWCAEPAADVLGLGMVDRDGRCTPPRV